MRAVAMLLVGRFMHVMNGVLDVLRGFQRGSPKKVRKISRQL